MSSRVPKIKVNMIVSVKDSDSVTIPKLWIFPSFLRQKIFPPRHRSLKLDLVNGIHLHESTNRRDSRFFSSVISTSSDFISL